jgi:hypothetical protein
LGGKRNLVDVAGTKSRSELKMCNWEGRLAASGEIQGP